MEKEDVVHIYNRILFSHKKNEILPFATTWIDLEIITLSEVRQRKTNTPCDHIYVESKKKNNNTNELIYKIETDSQTQKTNLWLPKGEGRERRDKLGVWK